MYSGTWLLRPPKRLVRSGLVVLLDRWSLKQVPLYTYYMLCDLSNEWCFLFCLVVCTTKSMFAYSEYS